MHEMTIIVFIRGPSLVPGFGGESPKRTPQVGVRPGLAAPKTPEKAGIV
jgi:hypothetical protein